MNAYASNIYDGAIYNAIATTPIQSAPDNVQVSVVINQTLIFIKQYTTEFFVDAGIPTSTGFPFTRLQGAVVDYGTEAPFSVCKSSGGVFWLGTQRGENTGVFIGVIMLTGYTPTVVSTPAITYRMSLWTDRANVFSYSYSEGSHTFVVFTSPGDNQTFVFDATIFAIRPDLAWCEQSTYTDSPYLFSRHASNCYAYFAGKHLVGDWQSGNIFQMSSNFFSDYGLPIVSVRRTNHIFDKEELENLFILKFQLDVDAGEGNTGPATPATATCALTGSAVSSATVTYAGYDYTSAPQVLFVSTDGNGSGAAATAVISYGSVQGITITSGGSGYTSPPTVVLTGPGVTPTASLSWSRDNGHTFGNEHVTSIGNAGEYKKRAIWRRQGVARDKVLQITLSDASKRVILGGYAEVDE
jgi:hypothetical protein